MRFESKDEDQRWRVFRQWGHDPYAAAQHGFPTLVVAYVHHSVGENHRANVVEAKAAAERNGFVPVAMTVSVFRRIRAEDGYYDGKPCLKPNC